MESAEGRGLPDDTGTQTQPAVPPESDKEQKRNRAYLVVLAGVSAGEMYKITAEKTLIGRGAHVSLRITDDGVSREHCQLVREGERIVLRRPRLDQRHVLQRRARRSPRAGRRRQDHGRLDARS